MLKAYLYQASHSFFKRKINVVFTILAVLGTILMLAVTGFMTYGNNKEFDPSLICGGISILTLLVFDFSFINVASGMLMYTNPDVNFMFAGPFTKKFNLIIPIVSSLKTAFLMVFIVSMQAANLSNLMGLRTRDAFLAVGGVFVVTALGSVLSQIINAAIHNKKTAKNIILGVFIAFHVLLIITSVASLYNEAGSFSGISSLGTAKIIGTIGTSFFLKLIPIGGWTTLIFDGIYMSSVVKLVLGFVLLIASVALIVILFNNIEFDYYEEAIAAAQKMAEKMAAKSAGVEDISSVDTSKIKVDGTGFTKGSGASVFFYKHLLENKRFSKLFFINKTMLIYKAVTIVYIFIMKNSIGSPKALFAAGLMMATIFDTMIFAGGKSVLEYNKPYFFLIPEKMSKKLWACVAGSIPEVLVNAAVGAGIFGFFLKDVASVPFILVTFAFFVVADITCIFIANIVASLFNYMSKTPALMLRQFSFISLLGVALVPAFVCALIFDFRYTGFMVVAFAVMAVLMVITSIIGTNVIKRKEMA